MNQLKDEIEYIVKDKAQVTITSSGCIYIECNQEITFRIYENIHNCNEYILLDSNGMLNATPQSKSTILTCLRQVFHPVK
jgi:hypothetical protein